jgi:hypothetical protein
MGNGLGRFGVIGSSFWLAIPRDFSLEGFAKGATLSASGEYSTFWQKAGNHEAIGPRNDRRKTL